MTVFLLSSQKIKVFLFSLLFLLLPVQIGKHFWPSFAFVLGQRVDYLSPTLYLTDIISVLCILTSITSFKKIHYLIIGFLSLVLSIGIYFSTNPFAGWYELSKLLECIFLGYSFKIFFQEDTYRKILLSQMLAIGVIGESLIALLQFFLQHSLGGIFYFLGERTFSGTTPGIANASLSHQLVLRPYATFSHPNVLAAYLLLSMLLISSVFFDVSKKAKMVLGISLVLGTCGLLISLSRAAILIWAITCLGICIYYGLYKRKSTKLLLHLIALVLVAVSIFLYSPLAARFLQTTFYDEAVTQRIQLMEASITLWQSNILFGVGFENFLTNLPRVLPSSSTIFLLQPVHNIFLLILAETGLIGLIFFFWIFIQALKNLFSHLKKDTATQKNNIIVLTIAFASVIILGMNDHYFLTLQQGQLLFTLVLSLSFL